MDRDEFDGLDALPRPERIRKLWRAMSRDSQRKVWARLPGEARAEVVAACFDASIETVR